MDDLRVEHGRIVCARLVRREGEGRILGDRIDAKTLRQAGDAVAMAHPDWIALALFPYAVEELVRLQNLDLGAAELRRVPALDLAAKLLAKRLLAIANSKNWHLGFKDCLRRAWASSLRNRRRAAGEDDRFRPELVEGFPRLRERMDLAIDARFPHAPGDELGDLGPEIDDEDAVVLHTLMWRKPRRVAMPSSAPGGPRGSGRGEDVDHAAFDEIPGVLAVFLHVRRDAMSGEMLRALPGLENH